MNTTFAMKWLLMAHFVSCFVLSTIIVALGVRLRNLYVPKVRRTLVVIILFITTQIPITLVRFSAADRGLYASLPFDDAFMGFLWSPMLSPVVIWLYVSHAAKSCYSCAISVPRKNVVTLPTMSLLGRYFMAGAVTTVLVKCFGVMTPEHENDIIRFLGGVAMLGTTLEIIYIRAKHNVVRMTSATWAWAMGTAAGAVGLALL